MTGPDLLMVSRDTMPCVVVCMGEQKRVGRGWLMLFKLLAMLVIVRSGGPMTFIFFRNICRILERNCYGQHLAFERLAKVVRERLAKVVRDH